MQKTKSLKNKDVIIELDPSALNEVYLQIFQETSSRFLILYGGAGSGKSVAIVQKILVRIMQEEGHNYLVCRKVARSLNNSVFAEFKNMISQWGLTELFKITQSPMEITFLPNGSRIFFTGLDDVEKLKSISKITSMWIEEASEITQADFQQLNLRMRGRSKYNKQIIISFNPISHMHWLRKYFFKNDPEVGKVCRDTAKDNTLILRTTYKNNKFLDSVYIKELEELKEKDELFYIVYALGEWGVLGDRVYKNYVIQDIKFKDEDFDTIVYGLDFGFNDPNALVKVGIKDGEIYILDELYKTKQTTDELIEDLKERIKNKRAYIYCDSAYPSYIKSMRLAGFINARGVEKGPDSIMKGIDNIKSTRIHIASHCQNFINEITIYKYKQDKDENVLEEPVDFMNHLMDAMRYALERYFKETRFMRKNIKK